MEPRAEEQTLFSMSTSGEVQFSGPDWVEQAVEKGIPERLLINGSDY